MRGKPAVVALCICLSAAATADAQGSASTGGQEVRVWTGGGRTVVHTAVGLSQESLVVRGPDGLQEIPVASFWRVDVRRQRTRGSQMGRDAAIFGLGAAVAGAALGLLLDRGQDPYYSPGDDFLMGAVVLAVPGMGLGALVGALRNPGSFWARVPPDELEVALRAGDAERVRD